VAYALGIVGVIAAFWLFVMYARACDRL